MNTRAFFMTLGALGAVFSTPVSAAADRESNSGFGSDLFTGAPSRSFEDPAPQEEPAALNELGPSAGEEDGGPESVAPASGEEKQDTLPGTGGMKSTLIEK